MSMVEHAQYELELIGEDQDVINGYLRVIQAFADMGHSGGSASVAIPVLHQLFQQKNLHPLTDNPAEWQYHDGETWGDPGGKGIWQNRRNGEAFSHDRGVTYYLLSEGADKPLHISEKVAE